MGKQKLFNKAIGFVLCSTLLVGCNNGSSTASSSDSSAEPATPGQISLALDHRKLVAGSSTNGTITVSSLPSDYDKSQPLIINVSVSNTNVALESPTTCMINNAEINSSCQISVRGVDAGTTVVQASIAGSAAGESSSLTVYPLFAYISNWGDFSITQCRVNADTGIILNTCEIKESSASFSLVTPERISFYHHTAYIPNSGGGLGFITACAVNDESGINFSSCSNLVSPYIDAPNGITTNNGYLYLTAHIQDVSGGYGYTKCKLNSLGQVESSTCSINYFPASAGHPSGITANNNYVYVWSFSSNNYTQCSVNPEGGSLIGCISTAPSELVNPNELIFYANNAYFANENGNGLAVCPVGESGILGSLCSRTTLPELFPNPSSIDIKSGFAYITNYITNNYTLCSIGIDGVIDYASCNLVDLPEGTSAVYPQHIALFGSTPE